MTRSPTRFRQLLAAKLMPRTRARRDGRDAGRVSVFLAIAFTGLLIIAGVAVDAAGALRTLMRADNLAAEAARAAGQGVDTGRVRGGGQHAVDPERAIGYATDYLAAAGVSPAGYDVDATAGTTVSFTVTLTYQTRILRLIGITEREVSATSTATLVSD